VDLEIIAQLIKTLEESKLTKMIFKQKDFELHLEKGTLAPPAPVQQVPHPHVVVEPQISHAVNKPGEHVKSPMVGTYYGSPSPDQPAFVKVGDKISENTVVCIIEAMKVMNEVKAGVSGVVAEILVSNAESVEFGTKLFRIT
jgi:acetyl-CoA carboxylase biotin carboxyl carrier protein